MTNSSERALYIATALYRPFQMQVWSSVTSYYSPLQGSHCHTLDTVNSAMGMMLCSSMLAFEKVYRPFSHCIDQTGLGAFTAKSGRKHYNPPPLTVMWMNFDSPNFPSFCSLSAIISFQTCSNKCILYVLSFHKCIKIKYKMVNMYGVFCD